MNFDTDPTSQRAQRLSDARSFVLAGKEFRYRAYVAPDVLDEYRLIGEQADDEGMWRVLDATMERLLEPGQIEAWRDVTREGVVWRDVMEVIGWISGRIVGRPPTPQDSSSSTPEAEGELNSKGDSSSLELTPTG